MIQYEVHISSCWQRVHDRQQLIVSFQLRDASGSTRYLSTGLSIRECVAALQNLGANVVAAACLIDRSGGEADVGVPLVSLIEFKVPAYPADQLPPELAAIPAVKPGSRGIQGVK